MKRRWFGFYKHDRMRYGIAFRFLSVHFAWAIGLVGPEWNGEKLPGFREHGKWLGGASWQRYGPFVVCRFRAKKHWWNKPK